MKPFEELYTAWIDGLLTGEELAEFEGALPDRAAAEADRAQARSCGEFLRRHSAAPVLSNADFFSHQLMERIAAEERLARPALAAPGRRFFTWPGLAWASAFCALALIGGYYVGQNDRFHRVPITSAELSETAPAQYEASIINPRSEDPAISTSVYSDADGMKVLWLDGLDYLPASYQLQ
jgi:hypothetical protein